MGASISKTANDIVNESIIEAIVETALKSQAAISAEQTTIIMGTVKGSTISQRATLSLQTLQNVKVDNDMIAKMEEKIRQAAEANGTILSVTVADSSNNMRNILRQKVTTSTVQEAVAGITLKQTTVVGPEGQLIDSTIGQVADLFSKNMQETLNSNKIAQDIVADVDQKSTATTSLFGSWTMYIIIFVILIMVVGAVMFFRGGGEDIEIIRAGSAIVNKE
jgi:hypothetical protein